MNSNAEVVGMTLFLVLMGFLLLAFTYSVGYGNGKNDMQKECLKLEQINTRLSVIEEYTRKGKTDE